MATAAEKWLAEQARMKARLQESAVRWPDRDDDIRSWPILVTEQIEHVVWVEAGTHDEALSAASEQTYELISPQTCIAADMNVVKPTDDWDWRKVYENSYHSYAGLKYDAHVQAWWQWRAELDTAHAEATADQEDLDNTPAEQRMTCGLCRAWREEGHDDKFQHRFELQAAGRRTQEAVTV